MGGAINPANEGGAGALVKAHLVQSLAAGLEKMGKRVKISYF